MLFDTDKTFLLPGAMRGIRELKRYYGEHPGMEVLVVGHTDSIGDPGYNVKLSRERARAIASFLRDQADDWLANYRGGKPAGRPWGAVEDQLMLQQLAGYDGKIGPKTREAIRRFQDSAGLPGSGNLDDTTRRQLVTRYLAQDGTTLPDGTQLTVHGCGPYHPEDNGDGDEARRRNRRVEIFLSQGPIDPPPGAPDGREYDAWVRASTETVAILYNTGEGSFASGPDRNPDDFDARAKDFNATNFPVYADMKDAFATGCRWTIWGCSATTHFKNCSRKSVEAIKKGLAETDFFVVDTAYYHDGNLHATQQERTSEIRHRWAMDALFRKITYPAEAAAKLDIEVRSACPGVGSDPTTVDGIEMLMIDLVTYMPVYDYFHRKFAPELKETTGKWDKGYIDYHALQGRAAVATPPFDQRRPRRTPSRAGARPVRRPSSAPGLPRPPHSGATRRGEAHKKSSSYSRHRIGVAPRGAGRGQVAG